MANTTTETLSVNGVVLNTFAKNIESLAGRLRTPARRTSNITVPGRHGSVRNPNQLFAENILTLPMWVIGCDDDGNIPAGSTARREFFKRIDELSALFLGSVGPLDVRHTLPDGSVRQCFADVLDAIDFSSESANPLGKFGVSLTLADPFWQDLTPTSQEMVANGSTAVFTSFQGATAPMEDLTATIMGPWNNPKLTFSDGSWVMYSDTFTSTQGVIINSGNWSLTGVGGKAVALNKLTYSSSTGRWMSIPPNQTSSTSVTLAGTARTTATKLTLAGRRKYLVG
jgi:hypothetical protein